jgi:hypothetical protein
VIGFIVSGSEDQPTFSVPVVEPPAPDVVGFASFPACVHASRIDGSAPTARTVVPDRTRKLRRVIRGDGRRFVVLMSPLLPRGPATGRRALPPLPRTNGTLYIMLCMRSGR